MNTISSIYDETAVSQVHVPYTPAAIENIISQYINVLGHTTKEDCSIIFSVDGYNNGLRPAIRALRNTRFKKPVRIRTDGRTQIILELVHPC